MQMTLRWFGPSDSVELWKIRQIPGVVGVVTSLYNKAPGEVWIQDEIRAHKKLVEDAGLKLMGIESVNIHDAIKVGAPEREQYIDNYITTLENLAHEGIHLVCYNFMPVFDWTRSDLAKPRSDGSTVLAYNQAEIDKVDPSKMFEALDADSNGFMLPGWEPERMARVKELFEMYAGVDDQKLFDNLVYFLQRIMPTCEKHGVYMAIHPDDPAWPVFGLPRIVTSNDSIQRLMKAVDNPHNGVTLCSGSLSSNPDNDIPATIRALKGRIHFAHVRNTKHNGPKDFEESAHLSSDGSLDMHEVMKALHDIGFTGIVRPDHGRAIWGEVAMPGYGLYDRAIGASYLIGLWEAIEKSS
ncbi:MAG: mannonate dehydratase [Defluviitaleaceae bacterium]|nr:mannonate dehydratase [Defluviitaleaceae bacterium]